MPRLDDFLARPHVRLPRPLDAVSEWWAARRPRVRMLVGVLAVVVVVLALDARTRAVDARWGGEPQDVVVATDTVRVGEVVADVRKVEFPPAAVPDGAVAKVPSDAVAAFAMPRGAVVTRAHLDVRGAAAGLEDGMRAVPVPTESGWGVVEGGWVDVWVLSAGDAPSRLVARSRPVVEVRSDDSGITSLVGIEDDEVAAVTSGLALGGVLLAHAPAPEAAD